MSNGIAKNNNLFKGLLSSLPQPRGCLSRGFFGKHPTTASAVAGVASGLSVGVVVAYAEALKVRTQANLPEQATTLAQRTVSRLRSVSFPKEVAPFAGLFGVVCGLEFTAIEALRHHYGEGIASLGAGLSGAACLTLADNLIYRRVMMRHQGKEITTRETLRTLAQQSPRIFPTNMWAGYRAMVCREAPFAYCHIIAAMPVGGALQRFFSNGHALNQEPSHHVWAMAASALLGPLFALLSQPFDSAARELQKQVFHQPGTTASYRRLFQTLQEETAKQLQANPDTSFFERHLVKILFRGVVPRMILATFGGMAVGAVGRYLLLPAKVEPTKEQQSSCSVQLRP